MKCVDIAADGVMCHALQGGWASGKTWAGARKLMSWHVFNSFDIQGNLTGVPSGVIGPTYSAMKDYDLPAVLDACKEFGLRCRWKAGEKTLYIDSLSIGATKSRIIFRSAERPELIAGYEVGVMWGDEPARWPESFDDPLKDAYIQAAGRIRHPKARALLFLLTFTNEGDATRIYAETHDPTAVNMRTFTAKTKDNKVVDRFEAEQRRRLPPELAAQYLDGEALTLRGGKVYAHYDRKIHRTEKAILSLHRRLSWTMDFNIDPGMHGYLGQRDAAEDMFIIGKEFHAPRMDVRNLAIFLAAYINNSEFAEAVKTEAGSIVIHGDATGKAASVQTSLSAYHVFCKVLDAAGIKWEMRVNNANPLESERVASVNMALCELDGTPHVAVHPSCELLLKDFNEVKYDEKGKIFKKNRKLTHASDAVGYWIHYERPVRLDQPIRDFGSVELVPSFMG